MSKRWLSGVLILALSVGCTFLAANAAAQELIEDSGTLEDGLSYVNTERDIRLINTGKYVYLVMVQREPGTLPVQVPVSSMEGAASLSGFRLSQAILYRLEPVKILDRDFWRPCSMGDCSWTGPLPPPPPPIVDPAAIFIAPQLAPR